MSWYQNRRFWHTFPLRTLVEDICRPLGPRFSERVIGMVIDIPANQMITAERELLRRAVQNLVLNAIDAMPNGGLLTITSACGQSTVELEIADTGPNLSDEQRHQAFELNPVASREGTGWGLAVVRRIAELHGGEVTVANCPEGAAFTLRIPRPTAMEAAA